VYYRTVDAAAAVFPTNKTQHTFAEWQSEGHDLNGVVADPQFDNPTANDYSKLLSSSPALARVRS